MIRAAAEARDMLQLHVYVRSHNTLKILQLIAQGSQMGGVHNTEHTRQENVAWKSDGSFRKLGISRESSMFEKEFRGASE
jgi:hypothetical protein